MWWIILVSIIGGLIVLGILILSIPCDLVFHFAFYDRAEVHLRWKWLFGLLSREIKQGKRKQRRRRVRGKFSISKTVKSFRSGSEILQIRGLMAQILKFIRRMFSRVKIRELEIQFCVGLDDPSETFYLFAVTEPFNRLVSYLQPYPISIQPCFVKPAFEGYASGTIRVYPVTLATPVIQLIFSISTFRLVRKMAAKRWRRNT